MILISGEALIDLIPDPEKTNAYDAVLGGSPYNVAIGLGRLGSETAFLSRISTDGNGEALADGLRDNHVDISLVVREPRPTTLAFVMRGTAKTGSRYSFYLDGTAYDGPWPFPEQWPQGAEHLHVGSFSAVERHGEAVAQAMKNAGGAATVSYDPNIRPFVTPDRASVTALVERQASLADVVKASEEDLAWLYPDRPIEDALATWAQKGPRFCVATLGEKGALAMLGAEANSNPGAARGSGRHGGCGRQLHVRASGGHGPGRRARRLLARAGQGFARTMASVRRLRLGHHLHAQGIESADPRRSRAGARRLTGPVGLWVKGGAIAGARRQGYTAAKPNGDRLHGNE